MKRTTHIRRYKPNRQYSAFPNAATAADRYNRLIDYMLTGATTLGVVTALLFLVTL